MALDIGIAVASEVAKLLVAPIGRHVGYAWNCNDHIGDLRNDALDALKVAEANMKRRVEEAQKRGNKIDHDVDEWLLNAHQFIEKAEVFLREDDTAKKWCFIGLCPDLKTRYKQGRKAKEMLDVANDLKDKKEKVDNRSISYRERPKGIWPIKNFEVFESRKKIFEDIMQALRDPEITKIGVFGITGVGKTTLVNEVAMQALEDNLFEEVAMATVFQDHNMKDMGGEEVVKLIPDLKRIQGEIRDGLGFEFQMTMERGRADELRERLKDEKKKLLVLDNILAGLKLEDVGIPSDHEGCKILMTSTNETVLTREMGSKNNFQLDVLDDDEARDWFKKLVGSVATDRRFEEVSIQVADKCGCLPILLVTVAKGLKDNRNLSAWNNAFVQLSDYDTENMHKQVDKGLELNYELLSSNEMKQLFLLSGQFQPSSIPIHCLLKYGRGLKLFKNCKTLAQTRNRLLTFVEDLKASSLLLQGNDHEVLKMHGIVHNFAVSVASKAPHDVLTVACGDEMHKWPEEVDLKRYTAISLPYCKIPELPAELDCPKLKSFVLFSNDRSLKIPDNFFRKLEKLRVLDLTGMQFSPLFPSLEFLTNLRTLCLECCDLEKIENFTVIGKLKKLEILSFSGSDIVQLPIQIAQLTLLRLLDLSECQRLKVIPPNVLSCLTKLEDLQMRNSFLQWEIEGQNSQGENAKLAELKKMLNLNTLDIHITNVKMLPDGLFFEKLERFRIFIGDGWNWNSKYNMSKTLKLKLNAGNELGKGIKSLIKKAEDLYLNGMKGVLNSVCEFDYDGRGFPQLKHLHVQNSPEIKYIINSKMTRSYSAFPGLESLSLDGLNNLEKICCGQLGAGSFGSLRMLKVGRCDALKNLFSTSMARCLLRLEEIKITDCKVIEEIVTEEIEGGNGEEPIEFTRLCALTLESLPHFTSFCSWVKAPTMSVTRQKLEAAEVLSKEAAPDNDPKAPMPTSKKSVCFGSLFCSKVKAPSVSGMEQKLTAIDLGSVGVAPENDPEASIPLFNKKVVFPKLKSLKLSSINLEKIWPYQLMEISPCIQNLTSLMVDKCDNLKYLLSSAVVKSLVNLKKLEICNCKTMEEIIVTEGFGEEWTSKMSLHKLEFLELKDLPRLVQFCRTNLLECPALETLWIDNCSELRTFVSTNVAVCSGTAIMNSTLFNDKVAFPNLKHLGLLNMNRLNTIWHNEFHENSFSKLKSLYVEGAEELRNTFSSYYMLRRLQNLENLCIEDCKSLNGVFDLREPMPAEAEHVATKLKKLTIGELPNLERIWSENAREVLSFENLDGVSASGCSNIKSLFPPSIAKSLRKLTFLEIYDCGVEEIISKEEGKNSVSEFEFPELTHINLEKLPELIRFCSGNIVELPKLKTLAVYDCEKLEIFASGTESLDKIFAEDGHDIIHEQPLISTKKETCNLEELPLNSKDAAMIWHKQFSADLFCNLEKIYLQYFNYESTAFPLGLIQRFNNLKYLAVGNSCFKEMFAYEGLDNGGRTLAQLEFLGLYSLCNLKNVKVDHVLTNLTILHIWHCKSLINLAPSSASFPTLEFLDVYDCEQLVNLVTFRTAESLVRLTKMTIRGCKMLKEIVASEGDEGKDEISFPKLETMSLDCLISLTSFCSANWTLKFPSLEEVVVKQCPKMMFFSPSLLHTPKLQRVQTEGMDKKHWKDDLNTTIKQMCEDMVGFNGLQHVKLSEFPELKERWPDQLPVSFFESLNSLVVEECALCQIAVPSNLLSFLSVLEELEVSKCDSVVEVFDLEQPNADGNAGYLSKLNKFQLVDLPKLRHVWIEKPEGILNFKNLKVLKIQNCGNLINIFTPTMVLGGLLQLKEIEVKSCPEVEEIIGKGVSLEAMMYKFPALNSIVLESLPKLRRFYSGSGTVECPSLKVISIIGCPRTFTSAFLREQEPNSADEVTERKVLFPNLETLGVEWDKTMEKICYSQFGLDFFCKLKGFWLMHFPIDCVIFPCSFLKKLSNLERLDVSDAFFEEIILFEETNSNEENQTAVLARLRELRLSKLHNLKFLAKEDSKSWVVFQNLEILTVSECGSLKFLVPSSVTFWHLTVLEVSKCNALIHLISPSTANSLAQLTKMSVTECEMIEEIVAADMDNEETNEIAFKNLKCLILCSLPRIVGFYLGKCAFLFPSLEELQVLECPKMNFFSQGVVSMPKLMKLQFTEGNDEECWESNLNPPMKQLFTEMAQPLVVTQPKPIGSPRQPALNIEIGEAEKNITIAVSNKKISEDLDASGNPDVGKDVPVPVENTIKLVMEKHAEKSVVVEPEIIQLASIKQDSYASSSNKVDSEKSLNSQIVVHNETEIPLQIHPADKNEQGQNLKMSASSIPERGTMSVSCYAASEQAALSTSVASTETTFSKELIYGLDGRPFSKTPSSQITEISPHSPVNFESLFASIEELLKPSQRSSSPNASSSITDTEFNKLDGGSSENYDYSMHLIKNILKKNLTEVARSSDAIQLLNGLKNLKKCPLLNAQQLEIIQYYIDNFDDLVTYHPLYEQQIDTGSSLMFSIENNKKGISKLRTRYEDFTSRTSSLNATKEALKKRLHEIEEEEDHIRGNMGVLYTDLVTTKGELETRMNVFPQVMKQQKEAEDKASKANDSWATLRSLFP